MSIVARPSGRTPEIVDEIIERLSRGEPLSRICDLPHMPDFTTVWRWEKADEEFRNLSARAMQHGTHFLAGDCLRIADDPDIDPGHKRIMVDTRMRLIGKWNAKVYGDKTLIGSDPENPLPSAKPDLSGLSESALREIAALEANTKAKSG